MKRINIIYWIVTVLVAFQAAFAGILYFTSAEVVTGFGHLGFPDYFRRELGVAKLIAAAVLLLPMVPLRVKEWAYAGLGITFLSAFIAHTAVDGMNTAMAPVVSLVLLVISYIYLLKRHTAAGAVRAAA
ncbi:MAG TPA: DoxX family protein [Flavobacteriales bacterium]